MRRTTLLLLSLGLILGLLIAAAGATGADGDGDGRDEIVRWDLSQIVDGVILPGGSDVAAAANGDTITLTGSGHVEPGEDEAFGGGTFVHKDHLGAVVGQGVYHVTELRSWRPLKDGTLAGAGLTDGIADIETASSGILKVGVRLVAAGGTPQLNAKLTVFCHLPGTIRDIPEGVALKIPALGLNFDQQVSGVTLFHILED